jgi:hypothetical protein
MSTIVGLRSNGASAERRDLVGRAAARRDQAAPAQSCEGGEIAVDEAMSIAVEAVDGDDAAAVTVVMDTAALGQHVQDALFRA